MIPRLLTVLLLLPAVAFAAAALPIEFNGVVVEGNKIQVSLLNPNTGSAKWVTIGGKFDNYTVTSCNVNAVTSSGQPIQNPSVVLTSLTTHTDTTILIKSSQILASPAPGQPAGITGQPGQPGMGTNTTVTVGPNGPVVSVGPGAGGGQPPPPGNPADAQAAPQPQPPPAAPPAP
jgi:hypothetical protein